MGRRIRIIIRATYVLYMWLSTSNKPRTEPIALDRGQENVVCPKPSDKGVALGQRSAYDPAI